MRPLGATMTNEAATDRMKGDLHRVLDHMRTDLERVEILAVALGIFSRPVPDYEPRFHHLHRAALDAHELGETDKPKPYKQ